MKNTVCFSSFFKIGMLVMTTILFLPSSAHAYRTEEDCEDSEGIGQCCQTPDGTWHRKAACDCFNIAMQRGDKNEYEKWIRYLNMELAYYESKLIAARNATKSTRGAEDKVAGKTKVEKAADDVAWAKAQINKAKAQKPR